MLGARKERRGARLVPISLEAAVPSDHFYRYLEAVLDLGFVRDWVTACYATRGRPSIDPVVFFKLQLVIFFEGVRSERQLLRVVADRLSVRWYLGYDLDEPLPDHSSLTRIRTRLGLPIFQRFFAHVVELCQRAGLVWGKELFFDATAVRANADADSLVPRWYAEAKAHLDDLSWSEPPSTAREAGADAPTPARLPFSGSVADEAQLAATNDAAWKLLEACRLDPERPPGRGGYQRRSRQHVSTTDPDATLLRTKEPTRLGYHDHYVVDGGRARVILDALVTPADVMENQAMPDLLHRVRFRSHLHVRRAVGDAAYGTIENVRALEEQGIRAYVPLRIFEEHSAYYPASRFTYDAQQDEYRCPEGQPLQRKTAIYVTEHWLYRADPTVCNACPVKAACTPGTHGRTIHRSFHAESLDRVRS